MEFINLCDGFILPGCVCAGVSHLCSGARKKQRSCTVAGAYHRPGLLNFCIGNAGCVTGTAHVSVVRFRPENHLVCRSAGAVMRSSRAGGVAAVYIGKNFVTGVVVGYAHILRVIGNGSSRGVQDFPIIENIFAACMAFGAVDHGWPKLTAAAAVVWQLDMLGCVKPEAVCPQVDTGVQKT